MHSDYVFLLKSLLPKIKQYAILLVDADDKVARILGEKKKNQFDVLTMNMSEFKKDYIESMWGRQPYNPRIAAGIMLVTPKAKFTTAALDEIERMLHLDTRGKSSKEIREEILRISEGLPKGHPLKVVPVTYPDRGNAIAAFTAIRQAILATGGGKPASTTTQENPMTKKVTDETAAPAKKPTKAELAAQAKAAKEAKAKEAADKKAADKAAKEAAKTAPAAKANGAAAPAKKGGAKKGDGAAAARTAKVLTGAYVLNGKSLTVKSPEELRLHEGSARYKLMAFMFAQAPKHKNGVPVEKIVTELGDEAAYAITSMTKTGYEFLKQVETK